MTLCDQFLNGYYGKLSFRDYTLVDRSVRTLEANSVGSPLEEFPWHPLRGIRPSHGSANAQTSYPGVWNWDCAFHAMAALNWDVGLAEDQIRIFLKIQLDNGKFPDVWRWSREAPVPIFSGGSKPPVLAWAAWEIFCAGKNEAFLRQAYPGFVKNEAFWRTHRGGDRYGLFHYDGDSDDPALRTKWSGWESGWDNSPRWDKGAYDLFTVDLNCYMVLFYRALKNIARQLEMTDDAARWEKKEKDLVENIETRLWNSSRGCYLDFDYVRGQFIDVITPASFMPLFIKSTSPERAESMARIAEQHMCPGWPTVSYLHPEYTSDKYWRGPLWLNVAYFALKGLQEYGFTVLADEGREQILSWVSQTPEAIHEYYDSRTGKALGVSHFGWSAAFIIKFVLFWNEKLWW